MEYKDLKFEDIINNLDEKLNELFDILNKSEYIERKDIKNINGIYVFFENNIPLYVGRSNRNRLRKRIQEHSRRGSNKNSATFAFLIFNEKRRKKLKNVASNDEDFIKAKDRVAKMKIKIIEINNPIIQTVLEPYIAYKLGTTLKYNKFITN